VLEDVLHGDVTWIIPGFELANAVMVCIQRDRGFLGVAEDP
jgi:hypothetical protein